MIEAMLFFELIKQLPAFEQKLVLALDRLQKRQKTLDLRTSRFELCMLLRIDYNEDNIETLDRALARLQETSLHSIGVASGFAVATKAIKEIEERPGSEKVVISLGGLFKFSP